MAARFALHPLRPSPMTRIRGGGRGSTSSAGQSEAAGEDGEGSKDTTEFGGAFVSSVSRLSSRAVQLGGMDEDKLRRYKTVMCQRLSGPEGCKYGVHCDLSVQQRTLAPFVVLLCLRAVFCSICCAAQCPHRGRVAARS